MRSTLLTLLILFSTLPALDIDLSTPLSYGGSQDQGTATPYQDGDLVTLNGNAWKAFALPEAYTITAETELTASLTVSTTGEIIGIGLVDGNLSSINSSRSFQLAGTQTWGIQDFRGQSGQITIPVGQFFTGQATHLVLIGDDDRSTPVQSSSWAHISVDERTPALPVFRLSEDAPLLVERAAGGLAITERAVIAQIQTVTEDALDPAAGYQLSVDGLDYVISDLDRFQVFIDQGRPGFSWTPISSVGRDALRDLHSALSAAEDAGLSDYDGAAAAGSLQSALRTMDALFQIAGSG